MYDTFKIPGFTDGLLYAGPISLFEAMTKVQQVGLLHFSIRLDGKPIGRIWLTNKDDGYNLGYWMHPSYQGNGYMKDAIKKILSIANSLGASSIVAKVHTWNGASKAVLLANGFTFHSKTDGMERYDYEISYPEKQDN